MIETSTSFEDSGYDCDHCGGEISKRTDRESGRPDTSCLQCRQCGCQWDLDGGAIRVGTGPHCPAAQRERSGTQPLDFLLSKRVMIALVLLLFLALVRFGGFGVMMAAFRILLPIGAAIIIGINLARFGRKQNWW